MVFNFNIQHVGLPKIASRELVDAYETALSYELSELLAVAGPESKGVNVHIMIELLQSNIYFARYGFYPGFGDLLFEIITTDGRA